MNIYFSSATVQSYENKINSMDLFYSPIVIFEGLTFDQVASLEDVTFGIESAELGNLAFDVQDINEAQVQSKENRVFIEFKMTKRDVAFQKENYECQLKFSATLESNLISHSTLGIVKTKYSKGLI